MTHAQYTNICRIILFNSNKSAKLSINMTKFKADSIQKHKSSWGTVLHSYSISHMENVIGGNLDRSCFFEVITHLLQLHFEDSRTMVCCILTTPFPKCHMCASECQSNMTAIYTHRIG